MMDYMDFVQVYLLKMEKMPSCTFQKHIGRNADIKVSCVPMG